MRRRSEGFFLDSGEIWEEYAAKRRQRRRALRQQAARGIISVEDAFAEGRLADDVMEELSPFFDYRWEEVGEDAARPR